MEYLKKIFSVNYCLVRIISRFTEQVKHKQTFTVPIAGIFWTAYSRSCASDGPAALFHAAVVWPPCAPEIAKALSSSFGWACIITSFETTILRTR